MSMNVVPTTVQVAKGDGPKKVQFLGWDPKKALAIDVQDVSFDYPGLGTCSLTQGVWTFSNVRAISGGVEGYLQYNAGANADDAALHDEILWPAKALLSVVCRHASAAVAEVLNLQLV